MLIAFNKPYGVLSQFTFGETTHRTLAEFHFPPGVYPVGRLDYDSEGLLLLSDEKSLVAKLLDPVHRLPKRYWAQVEREPTDSALNEIAAGIMIQTGRTLPCKVWKLDPQPDIPERNPPIRFRKNIPTHWLAIELIEGKNRQVRRMTAAIGHPTLRLIRVMIGRLALSSLEPGAWRILCDEERRKVLR